MFNELLSMQNTILISLFTGLIGLYLGHRLRIGSEAADRRRVFRNLITTLILEIRSEHDLHIYTTHRNSIPIIRVEAAKIKEDIVCWKRSKFDRACSDYDKFKDEDYGIPENYSIIRQHREKLLGTFIECSK
jgi:hypothetical protein